MMEQMAFFFTLSAISLQAICYNESKLIKPIGYTIMTLTEQREAARQFFNKWNGKGKEDEDARSYWIDILQNIFGMDHVTDRVEFEKKLVGADGNVKRIDVYIPETRVLIEQKSLSIALDKPQAGHGGMTPYEQAKYYDNYLPFDEKARWIITSNFSEIWIYDMNTKVPENNMVKIGLNEMPDKFSMLSFLMSTTVRKVTEEMELSLKAGELVGKIHDRFLEQYNDPMAKKTQNSLNILCVRLVFCLYAEDAGLFGPKDAFSKYISQYEPKDIRRALLDLFKVLDTPEKDRADLYLPDDLEPFPYCNGGLFANENIVIPKITQEIKDTLLDAALFDWSKISPTIFGAVFESTLNPETRRAGGMHYTSIENIHKVIDPLFLDDLTAELEEILKIGVERTRNTKLKEYQDKLASLRWLDPACGSGNFLTETYMCIRRLENRAIANIREGRYDVLGQITFGFENANPIKVQISQFYGIEINDFAVSVAKTALWIAESQMMKETEDVVHMRLNFLPLKTNAHIVEGNALRMDWWRLVSRQDLSYIMGNPPFVGASMMSPNQKAEAVAVFGKEKRVNSIDYVGAWYHKSAAFIQNTSIRCALVSTNSITQGEQVSPLWNKLLHEYHIAIDFAYRTFRWDSEANDKAHVHCVIIGFSQYGKRKIKTLYENDTAIEVKEINPYLVNAPDVLIESRGKPLCDVPPMTTGNKPSDGGNLILSEEEAEQLINRDSSISMCIRRYVGSRDFINNGERRYCLWLKGISPSVYSRNKEIMARLERVRQMRLNSSAAPTRAFAEKPFLFFSSPQTDDTCLCIPEVSSERRRYIPIGFLDKSFIASNKLLIVPNASLYHFGVLTSNVHMAWMRTVTGRLKSDYSYSGAVVYNNFPWPAPTDDQKVRIEQTAQGILDTRALYPDSSLADLYDPLTMPPELRKAHAANDRAVMQAYGFDIKSMTEADCVAALMKMYQALVEAEADKETAKGKKSREKRST